MNYKGGLSMAFDPENKNIKRHYKKNEAEQPTDTKDKLVIPVFKDEEERTKNYTFSLQPSARKRLDGLAKEHNFKSASKFLNELIKICDVSLLVSTKSCKVYKIK
jgi:hypothetical protein